MTNPNYVCTMCSQTFTRKWRGAVHNKNIHAGLAKTVRLIDYMIGRCNGEYIPSDPSTYRRKRKSGDLTEPRGPLLDKTMEQKRHLHSSSPNPPSARSQQQYYASDNRHGPDSMQQANETIIKTVELKRSLITYLPPNDVVKTLSFVTSCCMNMNDSRPLDIALTIASENAKTKEALDYLKAP